MKANLDKLKESYLRYLKIYIELQNPDGKLIRTFLDSWFAYKMKGNFLTKNNIPRWFNKLNTNKLSEAEIDLSDMNYAVCGLGDSNHTYFCGGPRKIDKRMEQLGAKKVEERHECDGDDEGAREYSVSSMKKLIDQ